jgi:hypothetical protein
VRGRAALGGDQRQNLVEVQKRGIGRREILGDEHERMPRVGHAWSREATEPGDDPLGDIVEVGRALAEVPAHCRQCVAERCERVVHRELRGLAGADPGVDLLLQAGVLRHHGLGLEYILRGATGLRAALLELPCDAGDRIPHPRRLLVGAAAARLVAGSREGLRHARDRSLGDAEPDAYASQFGHGLVPLTSVMIAYAASWSVESSSLRWSRVASALSPSALSVT